jgi:hemin uptake protein HemP
LKKKETTERNHRPKVVRSEDLFGKEKIILIQHRDILYRLIITRNEKLILNK